MKRRNLLLVPAGIAGVLAGPAILASPADEQRLVEAMTQWAELRSSGDARGAAAAAAEAQGLIARLRPDLAGPPPAPRATVFAYILELAGRRPGARAKLEAAFLRLQVEDTRAVLHAIKQALEHYLMDRGDYPNAGAKALAAALTDPRNPYVQLPAGSVSAAGELVDGWGRPLHYARAADGSPIVYSFGANGRDDGGLADDIAPPR
jgi:hypothetical protein